MLIVVDDHIKITCIYPAKRLFTRETIHKLRIQQQALSSLERMITDKNAVFAPGDSRKYCVQLILVSLGVTVK